MDKKLWRKSISQKQSRISKRKLRPWHAEWLERCFACSIDSFYNVVATERLSLMMKFGAWDTTPRGCLWHVCPYKHWFNRQISLRSLSQKSIKWIVYNSVFYVRATCSSIKTSFRAVWSLPLLEVQSRLMRKIPSNVKLCCIVLMIHFCSASIFSS